MTIKDDYPWGTYIIFAGVILGLILVVFVKC